MKTSLFTSLVLATLCFTPPTTAMAELYKCPSKTGGIEYSDTPCSNAARRDGDKWVNVEAERRQKEAEARREEERLDHEAKSFAAQQSAGIANASFEQPQRLCSALTSEGLRTEGWKPSKAMPGEWLCMTTLIPFGTAGSNGMENNIAFYVNGTSPSRANDIRIKININNSGERTQAFSRLDSATKTLFRAISLPVPPELSKAISQQKAISVRTAFGRAELILEPGRIDSFKIVLTDAEFLSSKEQTRNSSAGDFGSCKVAVGKAAGYSASLLSGDGEPVQESGYKSFMLKGQGKDLFFCEVHSGGRYKIKAALGGNFPFRYVAEGSF
jgi:hypothetical protein